MKLEDIARLPARCLAYLVGKENFVSNRIISRVRNSQMARNTLWMLLAHGLRIVIEAVYFVLIARALHVQGYGTLVGVGALVGILSPFAGMGTGNLLIKNVARDGTSYKRCLGNALLMVLISGAALMVIVLGVSKFVFPAKIPLTLVFLIAVSELFFARVVEISGQAFQAFHRLKRTALIQILPNVLRLIAIAGLSTFVNAPTVLQWGYLNLLCTFICMSIGMWLVNKELGGPTYTLSGIKEQIKEGFYFSVSHTARGVNNDIDKTMLARLSTLEATGVYGAAYRIARVAFTPILSLLFATYTRFFERGASGIRGSLDYAKKLFPIAGGYSIIVGILLVAMSPLLPYIMGTDYTDAANALRWLAPLPFLKAVQFIAGDTLTGADFQRVRSIIQVIVAGFNVSINLWLIPRYGWHGAAWASLASDGLLAVLMCLVVLFLCRRTVKTT